MDCKAFVKYGPIQQMFIRLYVDKLTTEKVLRKNRKLFFFLNIASNGEITKDELVENFNRFSIGQSLPQRKKITDEVFKILDFDGGGSLDYEEFIVTCIPSSTLLNRKTVENMFYYFGPNENDKITAKTILHKLSKYT